LALAADYDGTIAADGRMSTATVSGKFSLLVSRSNDPSAGVNKATGLDDALRKLDLFP